MSTSLPARHCKFDFLFFSKKTRRNVEFYSGDILHGFYFSKKIQINFEQERYFGYKFYIENRNTRHRKQYWCP